MHFLGLAGMPRRIPDYALQFTDFNQIASVGAFIFGLAQLLFLYNIIQCIRHKGPKATDRVWEGAHGLEWLVPSPAPYHTYTHAPKFEAHEHIIEKSRLLMVLSLTAMACLVFLI